MPTQPNVKSEEWENEFDRLPWLIDGFVNRELLKSFIYSLLQSTREETVRAMLPEKRVVHTPYRLAKDLSPKTTAQNIIFNRCLSEIKDRAHKLWGIRV